MQESKLKSTEHLTTNSFPNYTAVHKDQPSDTGGGGLVTLIHNSFTFIHLPSVSLFPDDSITEHLPMTATINNIAVNIHNIYIPPISCCPSDFKPNFHLIFNFHDNNIIMGDFNAHNRDWYSQTPCTLADARGTLIRESLTNSDLLLLNLDSPTTCLPSHGDPTSPDLTIASSQIALDSEWCTLTTLNSGHLPIIV